MKKPKTAKISVIRGKNKTLFEASLELAFLFCPLHGSKPRSIICVHLDRAICEGRIKEAMTLLEQGRKLGLK